MPRLERVLEAGGDVLWAAGEKDADAIAAYLREAGVAESDAVATSVHQGESSPVTPDQIALFKDFPGSVIVYFDRDPTGLRSALHRLRALRSAGVAAEAKTMPGPLTAAEGEPNDVYDYLAAGGALADFRSVSGRELRETIEAAGGRPESSPGRAAAAPQELPPEANGVQEEQLQEFVAALKDAIPDIATRRSGGRLYFTCPLAGELHGRGDLRPSFNVRPGERGGLVLACSCPGGAETGDAHTEWVQQVLDKLGLDWDAVSPPSEVTVGSEFPRNDTGNAELLRSLHGGEMAWVPERGEWFCWDGSRWTPRAPVLSAMVMDMIDARRAEARRVRNVKARHLALSWAVSCGNDAKIAAMLRRLAAMEGMQRAAAAFDADPQAIQFRNGTLVLEDDGLEFRATRKEDYCTAVVPYDYDPQARSRQWEQFLRRFVPETAVREYLQLLAGYSLLGENTQRKLIFLWGPTSTGKTTFGTILLNALGPALAGTFQLSMFRTRRDDAPRPDILKAMARRFVVAEEASTEWNLHADNIKQLTSHGRIEARGMRTNLFIERVPQFTPWIATNDLPEVRHADSATKKRLIAVPFFQQVTLDDDDSDWITRLAPADYSAILAWMARGWALYRERGLEQMPPEVSKATLELRESLSPVDIFLSQRTRSAPGNGVPGGQLYSVFEIWWDAEGHRRADIPTRSAFGRALTDRGFPAKHTNKGSVRVGLEVVPEGEGGYLAPPAASLRPAKK